MPASTTVDTPNGRRYEITFIDSSGKQRWQTVQGGLKEAHAARGDILSKLGRGERVAPTRKTMAEVAEEFLEAQVDLRPRTKHAYRTSLERHVLPRLGRRRVADITETDTVSLIAHLRRSGLSGRTVRSILTPFGRCLAYATRHGLNASNPMRKLERGERPPVGRREMRILDRTEIARLIDKAPPAYRTMLATAIFTGLRQGELLGLLWQDIDFEAGLVHVRKALGRDGVRAEPKTPEAKRSVVLMPALARTMTTHREQAFARGHAKPTDYVFSTIVGTATYYRNASSRGLAKAVENAGLGGDDRARLRFHDLRHTFASILVAQGLNVVFVSRQLGHASPDITLKVYSHLFDRAEHAERMSATLEASYGSML